MSKSHLRPLAELFKALADESRLHVLAVLLAKGEVSVGEVCEAVGQTQPAVSHHLTQLKHAGLVDYRREGKFNYYFVVGEGLAGLIRQVFPKAAREQQTVAYGDLEVAFRVK